MVYEVDGIKVVWSQQYAVYEVWKQIADGPDDFLWDCVADTPDKEWAIAVADEVWNRTPQVRQKTHAADAVRTNPKSCTAIPVISKITTGLDSGNLTWA